MEAVVKFRTVAGPTLRPFYKVCSPCPLALRSYQLKLEEIPTATSEKRGLVVTVVLGLQGGFQAEMTRREAALILGVRERAKEEAIKDAHRKIMIANHPDAGWNNFKLADPASTEYNVTQCFVKVWLTSLSVQAAAATWQPK